MPKKSYIEIKNIEYIDLKLNIANQNRHIIKFSVEKKPAQLNDILMTICLKQFVKELGKWLKEINHSWYTSKRYSDFIQYPS
jgi:hypothetical protein